MKPLPKEARTKNVSEHEFCRWCGDSAWVVARLRPAVSGYWSKKRGIQANGWYEELAPCPYCESGYREEFPEPSSKNPHPSKPPWDSRGYWRDVDEIELEPVFPSGFKPLSAEENARRMRDLMGRMGAIGREMAA